jgi:hypothetical protein
LLKIAGRHLGLRAISAREVYDPIRENEHMSEFSERVKKARKGFFKASELQEGEEITLTISHLLESVAMFNKEVDLLCFKETGRQLQLNQTTSEWLIEALGDDPETWGGKRVVLFLAEFQYEGETKMGIRLKLPEPATSEEPAQRETDGDIPF